MKASSNDIVLIPPALAEAISVITQKPLTLIVAGSGFGKTTAVTNCLDRLGSDTACHWYTCFGEPPERAWEGVCRLIAFADAQIGGFLSKLDLPTVDHLGYISSLMGELTCERETVLVIDNFQLAAFPAPYRLVEALSMHRSGKLHIVVLSHPLYTEKIAAFSSVRIHHISQKEFCFTPADTAHLFSLNDVTLSEEEAVRLCTTTEGWIAALKLHLAGFLAGGTLPSGADIQELMELSFWQRLNKQQQRLFLGLSLLDTFTEAQAARMLGRDVMQDDLWPSVCSNAFVRKSENEYTLHSLLKAFLAEKRQTQAEAFLKKMYARAGEACQLQRKNVQAILFFIEAEDDVGALSVPLTSLEMAELVRTKTDKLNLLLTRCRTEVLERRYLLLLGTAIKAGLNEKAALARTAFSRLAQLRTLPNGSDELKRAATAALEMAASFQSYNDIGTMSRHHAIAVEQLDDPQDFYITNDSWSFCIPSVVYMFWRKSGGLQESVSLCREGIPRYALLSGGKGLGGPEIMAAEATLLAGDISDSVSQAYLARGIAQKAGQDSILFCAYTLLARAALLRQDSAAFVQNQREIERLAFHGKEFLCVTASEVARGFLYSLLDLEDEIPAWMLSAESVRETLYPISVPFALIVTLRYTRTHMPEALIGTAEAFMCETEERNHLLPKIYFLLEEAVWYEQHGQRESALEKAALALSLAQPDSVLLPFAEYYAALAPVLCDKHLSCADAASLKRIIALGRQFANGAAAVRAALSGAFPLTNREREIAFMAKKNMPTRKIADALGISPATVKNTLAKVYSKLGIHGKGELDGRLL